jgi:hypothetical protein
MSHEEQNNVGEKPQLNDQREHIRRLISESETPKEQCYRFIGECYIHGLMDGEFLDIMKAAGVQFGSINIK